MTLISMIVEPDSDEPECAIVMVDCTISGRPYRFVLDTGSPRTHVVADDFTTTLATHGSHQTAGVFSATNTPFVTLPELVVGSAAQGSVDAVLIGPSASGARNLLGMDVLKRHCCHFRFDNRALIIDVDQSSKATRPLTMDHESHPYVEVSWRDAIAQCV